MVLPIYCILTLTLDYLALQVRLACHLLTSVSAWRDSSLLALVMSNCLPYTPVLPFHDYLDVVGEQTNKTQSMIYDMYRSETCIHRRFSKIGYPRQELICSCHTTGRIETVGIGKNSTKYKT